MDRLAEIKRKHAECPVTSMDDELWMIAEIERLRALVEKWPATADGVPAIPGMKVWSDVGSRC